jgi:hypothetical protein
MISAYILSASVSLAPVQMDQIRFAEKIVASANMITLGDVANLESLPVPLRKQASALPMMMVGGSGGRAIQHSQLASRARSLMPALAPWLHGSFEGQLVISGRFAQSRLPMARCDSGPEAVEIGRAVVVRVTAGPYQIERKATALQSARAGDRLFVRTADGDALAVQCEGSD